MLYVAIRWNDGKVSLEYPREENVWACRIRALYLNAMLWRSLQEQAGSRRVAGGVRLLCAAISRTSYMPPSSTVPPWSMVRTTDTQNLRTRSQGSRVGSRIPPFARPAFCAESRYKSNSATLSASWFGEKVIMRKKCHLGLCFAVVVLFSVAVAGKQPHHLVTVCLAFSCQPHTWHLGTRDFNER